MCARCRLDDRCAKNNKKKASAFKAAVALNLFNFGDSFKIYPVLRTDSTRVLQPKIALCLADANRSDARGQSRRDVSQISSVPREWCADPATAWREIVDPSSHSTDHAYCFVRISHMIAPSSFDATLHVHRTV
jgi:hypothetical protein